MQRTWRAIIREVSGIDNYQLMWSTTSDFKSYKTASLKPGTHSYTRKDLIPGKTYYIKVRTCKVVNGEKFYSFWSGVKSVKLS